MMAPQLPFKRHPADGILLIAVLAFLATQLLTEGFTSNALFNTFFMSVCAGIVRLYAVRFGGVGFVAWRRNNAGLVFLIVLFCGACASFLIWAVWKGYFGPVVALGGILISSFIIVSWLFLIEMLKKALTAIWNK